MPKYLILLLILSSFLFVGHSLPTLESLLTKRLPTSSPSSIAGVQSPSVKIVLLTNAVTKLKNQALDALQKQFLGVRLNETFSSWGYSVKNIAISKLEIDNRKTNIFFPSLNSVAINSTNINATMTFSYNSLLSFSYKNAQLSLQGISFTLNGNVSVTSKNKYQLNLTYFKITIGEMNISGINSFLQNIISFFFGDLKTALEKNLNIILKDKMQTVLQDLVKKELDYYPIPQVSSVINVFPLTPNFRKDFLEFQFDAFFATLINPTTRPQIDEKSEQIANNLTFNDDLSLIVNQYVLNTLGASVYQSQSIKMNITDKQVPDFSPIRLNTTGLNFLFPNITAFYGENQPMSIICELGDRPKFNLSTGLLIVNVSVKFQVFVKNQLVVTLQADSYFALNTSISKNNITMKVLDCKVFSLKISNTKLVLDSEEIQGLLNLGIISVIPYLENKVFQKGIPIPQIPAFPNLKYDLRIGNQTLVLSVKV